jgi:eukaryotic-like serine/threonine-protein kinase
MEVERWQKLEGIYHDAMALDPRRRAEFVQAACGGDEELQKELLSLLGGEEDAESFLDRPAMDLAARELAKSSEGAEEIVLRTPLPASIGRYRILRVLGEGGMGVVYEAEQEDPRRVVALKVIRIGLATPERLSRFRHESDALGRLQHPGIAQIYEASMADTGFGLQPYFAMELIRGLPLDRYAEEHRLSTRQKLELMTKICDAVSHAHQRGLIHRDLKPGNILVDEAGQPKILDFGVARVTEAEAQRTLQTEVGQIVGTLAYMSPEQVLGDSTEVDTRSDVYSLGVILYQLLSGRLPHDVSGQQIPEAIRTIRESDPASLSSISRIYRGDVETIVGKALEKDKSRRYASAAAMAADMRSYLNDEPIQARPPSATYQLAKFARRHRGLVAGVAAVFVVLVAGIAVSATLAVRARRAEQAALAERDRASRERDRATRITDFMTGMFKVSDPGESRGNSVTAREILDKASNDLGAGLASDPDAQTQMMRVMAQTYMNLGLFPRAHDLAQKALVARQKLYGPDDPRTLDSMTQLGDLLDREGHHDQAEKIEEQALAAERRVLGEDNKQTLDTLNLLVISVGFQGRAAEAEKLDREQIAALTRIAGPQDEATFAARTNLAGLLFFQAKYAEAEKENRSLLEIGRTRWGPDHPRTLAVMDNLAMVLRQEGRLNESEQMFRETLRARQRVQGMEHPETLTAMSDLGDALQAEGKLAESEKLYRQAAEISSRTLGADNPSTLDDRTNIAELLAREGKIQEAGAIFRSVLPLQEKVLGPENPDTLSTRSGLAGVLIREHSYADAEKLARPNYETQRRVLGPEHPDTVYSLQQIGTVLAFTHRYPDAVKLFHQALDAQNAGQGEENRWRLWYSFACVANAAGNSGEAIRYLQEAVNHGYADADGLINDEDLKSLRQEPRFRAIVATLKRPPPPAQTQ